MNEEYILLIVGDGCDADYAEERTRFRFSDIAIDADIFSELGINTPAILFGQFIEAFSVALEMGPNRHNWARALFDSHQDKRNTLDNFCIACYGFNPSEIEWKTNTSEDLFYEIIGDVLGNYIPYHDNYEGVHTITSIEYYPETSSTLIYNGKHKVTLILDDSNGSGNKLYFDTTDPNQIMFKMFNNWTTTSWKSEQQIIDEMKLKVVYRQST